MLTLKLVPQLTPQSKPYCLTLPNQITFHQLHAALEIILQPEFRSYYSFMLMASRHAIEANTAGDYKAVPAFKQNPQIRYLNPYPGTFLCLLEFEAIDDAEISEYPQVKGTDNDAQFNVWLKEYCCFTESWQYQNEDFFWKQHQMQGQMTGKQKTKHRPSKKQKHHIGTSERSQLLNVSSESSRHRFRTMEDKQYTWHSFCMMYGDSESVRVTVGASKYSQAELLETSKKDNLLNYCRYSTLSVAANWRKKQLAEAFCNNLQENTWLSMLLLPRTGLELYFRLCRIKENQKLSLSMEEAESLKVLMYLGMVDLLFTNEETDIRLELPADFKKHFQEFFKDSRNFAPKSECTLYLSPELKAGSWQKIVKGYEKLDYRAAMVLCRYGILSVEDLYEKLCACYGYSFSQIEFKRYLMLHLRLLDQVYTGHVSGSRERLAAPFDMNISYALEVQKKPVPVSGQKPVNPKELDEYGEWMPEQTEGLMNLLANYTEDVDLLTEIAELLVYAVLGNYTWEDYLKILERALKGLASVEQTGFWYELSKLYLYLPAAGLGGYSRVEYAEKEHLDNPYVVLNDSEGFSEEWEDGSVFGLSFEVQWQIFSYMKRFVEDGNELSEKRMVKYAKKHLDQEVIVGLQVYGYLLSGNPKLLGFLEKMADQRVPEAVEMLEELKYMFSGLDEEWNPYE